jgi:hypothetical protein
MTWRWTRLLCFAIGSMVVASCATPYQAMGLMGGLSATQIDANTMRISSRGNRFSDLGQMKDYVMLRAAEETLKHGYDAFGIVESENATRTVTDHVSHTSIQSTVGFAMNPANPGAPGTPVFGTANVTTYGTETYTKPGQDLIIKMFKGPKPDGSNTYSAAEVVAFLGPRVRGSDDAIPPAAPSLTGTAPVSVQSKSTQMQGVESANDASTPMPACTDQDRQLAQMAEQNGWRYTKTCQ